MSEKAVAKVSDADISVGTEGVELTDLAKMMRYSEGIVKSGVGPKGLSAAGVVVSIQRGAELGMKPMESLDAFAVIHGRAMLQGKHALGKVRATAPDIDQGCRTENGELVGWCRSTRPGWEGTRETTFSTTQAKRAGLGTGDNWKKYPERMLMWRAVGHHVADYYTDVLGGNRIAEDVANDIPMRVVSHSAPDVKPVGLDPILAGATQAGASDSDISDAEVVVESSSVTDDPTASPDTTADVVLGPQSAKTGKNSDGEMAPARTCHRPGCESTDLESGWCSTHFDAGMEDEGPQDQEEMF